MYPARFFRRLDVRLTLLVSLVVLVAAGGGYLVSLTLAERDFDKLLRHQFSTAVAIAENVFGLVAQMAAIQANHLAQDQELQRHLCADLEAPALGRALERFRNEIKADAIVILDPKGIVRQHSVDRQQVGQSWRARRIVRRAIDEGELHGSIADDMGNLVIYSPALVMEQGSRSVNRQCALVLVGYSINDALLQNIAEGSGVNITIVRRRAIMASTFADMRVARDSIPISYVDYQVWLQSPDTIRQFRYEDALYFSAARRLPMMEPRMEGSIWLVQPQVRLEEMRRHLVTNLSWMLAASLVLAVLLVARFSAHMLAPLKRLEAYARAVGRGERPDPPPLESADEIATLARELNGLLERLRESKANLEQKVEERTAELQSMMHKLEAQATHDSLTGLANRSLFFEQLRESVDAARLAGDKLAIIFVDLDGFKSINDTLGHQAGDAMLVELSHRLSTSVRESDCVARLGGDEFAVMLAALREQSAAEAVARKLLARLQEPVALSQASRAQRLSASVGVSVYPDDAEDPEELLRRADTAMYVAKHSGKDRVCAWSATTGEA